MHSNKEFRPTPQTGLKPKTHPKLYLYLGPPVVLLLFGEGSPTKIDCRKKLVPLFYPLKSGGPSYSKLTPPQPRTKPASARPLLPGRAPPEAGPGPRRADPGCAGQPGPGRKMRFCGSSPPLELKGGPNLDGCGSQNRYQNGSLVN